MIRRNVLLTISAILLVLFGVFIYINNDLLPSGVISKVNVTTGVKQFITPSKQPDEKIPSATDLTGSETEAALDAAFEVDESVDNFDDIIE